MPPKNMPYFQQLQQQFTAYIRDPQNNRYAPSGEQTIESRRLKVYQELFFNNLYDFFSQLFPVCKEVLGEQQWAELVREYLQKHQSQTPLFHQLGEEFLDFLHNEHQPAESEPSFLLELAHYEWVELALTVSQEPGFKGQNSVDCIDLETQYQLSPLAWPLAYEWPVHQISEHYQPTKKPKEVTTLLVYRSEDSALESDQIDFMLLTPLLYQWLTQLANFNSAKQALFAVLQPSEIEEQSLLDFAQNTLSELQQLGIVKPL